MDELTELRAALADEGKLDHLTKQAEYWLAATPAQQAEILADVRSRGHMERLLNGLHAAYRFHEEAAAMFRDTLQQIEAR